MDLELGNYCCIFAERNYRCGSVSVEVYRRFENGITFGATKTHADYADNTDFYKALTNPQMSTRKLVRITQIEL